MECLCSGITTYFARREVFYRELAARFYFPEAYSVSAILVEFPWLAGFVVWFSTIVYWLAGLEANAEKFLFFCVGMSGAGVRLPHISRRGKTCRRYRFPMHRLQVSL
jgi:hypothetical protein